jgi:hypothetical protein
MRHFAIALIERVPDCPAREATEQNARCDALGTATRRSPDQATCSRSRCSPYDGLGADIRARNGKNGTADQQGDPSQHGFHQAL